MIPLMRIDWIMVKRMWVDLLISIFMPALFFLLFSSLGMESISNPIAKSIAIRNYLLTMTSFSMSGFGFFILPTMLRQDKNNNWQTFVKHSPLAMTYYYISKLVLILVMFLFSILINLAIGVWIKKVDLSLSDWIGTTIILLGTGVFFIISGFVISQINRETLATTIGNLLYFVLAIFGGSWVPVTMFPKWMKSIAAWTPTYHINQLLTDYVSQGEIVFKSILVLFIYTLILIFAILILEKRKSS